MPLHFALLSSLILHAALVIAPGLLTAKRRPIPPPRLEARLLQPAAAPDAMAAAVSTEPAAEPIAPPVTTPPRALNGPSLRRAQAALSQHLFYPPQAVAQGLEGEVILLLTLSESGQLVSATVARSSGHALLDQAALEAAQRLGALPGNPRQTLFPVNFRLQ